MDYPDPNYGIISVVKNVKDKLDAPNKEVFIPIAHNHGIDEGYEVLNFCLDHSPFVVVAGSYTKVLGFSEKGKKKDSFSFYKKKLGTALQEEPELLQYLRDCAQDAWLGLHGGL